MRRLWLVSTAILGSLCPTAVAGGTTPAPVHGLWVWKSATVYRVPGGAEQLLDFCKAEGMSEVYLSVSGLGNASEERPLAALVTLLHRSGIRVEALLSSTDADEPGKHREALLNHLREVLSFNERHPTGAFDGIHLDVEPQQRPENKGGNNLRFLPELVDALRAAWAMVEPVGMTLNADIPEKLLKGDLASRKMLLSAVPRVTLMMYGVSHPQDGESLEQQTEKVMQASARFLGMAYEGCGTLPLARMVIALRTSDYGGQLPQLLKALDEANRANPRYLGWARHAYGDAAKATRGR